MNPIKDPVKDTLVPLQTNFNANWSVRWRTSLYFNLFHWPMGKNSGNGNGVCRYIRALLAPHIKTMETYAAFFIFLDFQTVCATFEAWLETGERKQHCFLGHRCQQKLYQRPKTAPMLELVKNLERKVHPKASS